MNLLGIHHVTAVSARIRDNYHFYTGAMGMRLVKRSVNQDDVSAYHLFYADALGTPGTDLTFFDWEVPLEVPGARSITRTHLRVNGQESLAFWDERLRDRGVRAEEITERDGRWTLDFKDAEGQRLSLVDDGGAGEAHPWDRSPVPARHQIRGLGPVVMTVPDLAPTNALLQRVLNMRPVRDYPHPINPEDTVHVYEMGDGGPAAELHVAVLPNAPDVAPGAGGVHHVAFRVPDDDYDAWAEHLNAERVPNSGKIDRFWFRSLYFREPNAVLFEIATDGPGFAVDEHSDTLGEKVVLPPFLEPRRAQILRTLKPID
jgi:glyoxalase family protein